MKHSNVFAVMVLSMFIHHITKAQTNFWQQSNGPFAGVVQSIAMAPDGAMVVGTKDGGVFRSVNNGTSWTIINSGLTSYDVTALVIKHNELMFAGTRWDGYIGRYSGVFRSTNNGVSWTIVGSGFPPNSDVNALAINSLGHIFAGTPYTGVASSSGLFLSTDNGNSWQQTALRVTTVLCLLFNSSGMLFVGTNSDGIFRSIDNGTTWVQINSGIRTNRIMCLAIDSTGIIYAGTDSGVYRSSNNGSTWAQVNSGLTSSYVLSLAVNPSGTIFAGTNGGGIFRSTDNGSTWTQLNIATSSSRAFFSLSVSPTGLIFAGPYGDGLYRSTNNGDTWQKCGGIPNTFVLALASGPNSQVMAGIDNPGSYQRVYRSTDNGNSWTAIGQFGNSPRAIFFASNGRILVSLGTDTFRSDDDGMTWVKCEIKNAYCFALKSNGHILAGTRNGVYVSTDNGIQWATTDINIQNVVVNSIAIDFYGHPFAATDQGVFRLLSGSNWGSAGAQDLDQKSVRSIVINQSGDIFIVAEPRNTAGIGTVYRSTNNGDNWTISHSGLGPNDVQCLALNSVGHVFAGKASGGVYRSTDNGQSWNQVNSGLTHTDIRTLLVNSNQFVFAGTYGNGVARSSLATVTFLDPHLLVIPEFFSLAQNFPNPFNPQTAIQFTLPQSADVTLKVFDPLGREVTTLVSEKLPAGSYTFQWTPIGLPSGIYFYRLKAGPFVQTRKLILLR